MSKFSQNFAEATRIILQWRYFHSNKKPLTLEMIKQSTHSHRIKKKWAYFGFIIFRDAEFMPNASTFRMQNALYSKQTRPPLPLPQKATNSTNASTINRKSQKQQEGQD
jgi:hypothetical protein